MKRVPLDVRLEKALARAERVNGCIIWPDAQDGRGYGVISDRGQLKKAHRVVFQHYGNQELGNLYVCHTCDVRACVNIEHLFVGTARENMHDKYAKGRANHAFGARSGSVKLTEAQARRIKFFEPHITKELAEELGVHKQTLYGIKWGRTWKHLVQ